jgi:ubiquinone/menaquinone biosynthesis C-methylase UbiE
MDTYGKIGKTYGFLWQKQRHLTPKRWHFNVVQEIIPEPIVRGSRGIDIGSGAGYDTYIMANDNPGVEIVSIDLSDGVYATSKLTENLKNVRVIKCSVSDIPLKDNTFDFAYSFGVLHHTPDPQGGLLEIIRILKKDSPLFAYLYEDQSENRIKYIALKVISEVRKATVRMPQKMLYFLCLLISPFVFIFFSFPALVLGTFKFTRNFSNKIPFNFGRNPFSLWGDLYDRFSTPIEYRFSKEDLYSLFKDCGFNKINIQKLNDRAGWVVTGYKMTC